MPLSNLGPDVWYGHVLPFICTECGSIFKEWKDADRHENWYKGHSVLREDLIEKKLTPQRAEAWRRDGPAGGEF